ncbi:hypothetical protein J3D46_003025 [Paenarthrobacter sp. A20]|nr:hypothetical protein [Paenarthrobacter sp. A20]
MDNARQANSHCRGTVYCGMEVRGHGADFGGAFTENSPVTNVLIDMRGESVRVAIPQDYIVARRG